MEDYNGADHQATQMNGNIYAVDYVDDAGQIHIRESGLAVISNVDWFVMVDCATRFDKKMSEIYDMIEDYLRSYFCGLCPRCGQDRINGRQIF